MGQVCDIFASKENNLVTSIAAKQQHNIDKQDITNNISLQAQEQIKMQKNYEIQLKDFKSLKCLARGSCGKVILVQNKYTLRYYAMKTIKKSDIIKKNIIDPILNERKILEIGNHPFIVKLKYAFQNNYNVYFLMEYMQGGELFHHIQKKIRFTEQETVYYSAQVLLALEYLHEQLNIVYRDLKPENILMDQEGNIKLSDFGLSKSCNLRLKSFCGTTEYMAPEIIKQEQDYGKPVDIWTLGCLIYEMLDGTPPFKSDTKQGIYYEILENDLTYPNHFSELAKDLLKNILISNPHIRFNLQQIKSHAFYQQIDWEKMLKKEYIPPIKPQIQNEVDTICFSDAKDFVQETPYNTQVNYKIDAFKGFTFQEQELKEQEQKK